MKILSIDCSASPASAAITENDKILAFSFINVKITHSQTLLPMIEGLLKSSMLSIKDIDGFAISKGPGSFTGIRIGINLIKGLAASSHLPCVGVSTLESMAYNYKDQNCIICAVMDARCNQVYNALFEVNNGSIVRLCEDRALMCEEVAKEIKNMSQNKDKRVIIIGDGTDIFYPFVKDCENVIKSSQQFRYQNALGVSQLANYYFANGNTLLPEKLLPLYLRLPQAERELKLKKEGK